MEKVSRSFLRERKFCYCGGLRFGGVPESNPVPSFRKVTPFHREWGDWVGGGEHTWGISVHNVYEFFRGVAFGLDAFCVPRVGA